ncbi:Predicted acylesterase/phospholipase RssA, contains patatin domain [Prosthecobacter debontii]|uniref:Predicted acylesterase/phospholipase RssA, contains patatin domain n=1 Tax=Prosthecobacter debontii TaxID=48467 RepID=A0A1T4WXC4_9BACT|nr:patatin-like phospholipase family protein [Prosthecobacter debontii]SKA82013.1 Predicted acylesterase/phospholipase RssA, contains patatin domain [Prosthecobacter debontii]
MKPRIAISLGSSFLGYATHAGFITRLHELGVRPVAVAGSSSGAVASGLYAAGLSPEQIRQTVLAHTFRRSFVRRTPWFTHYIVNSFSNRAVGAFNTDGAVAYLTRVLGNIQIQDLKQPRYMAAVSDLETSKTHFITQGPLAQIMIASCCIPTIFAPRFHENMHCFDGGVAHEAPIDPWLEEDDIDLIIMHRVTHHEAPAPKLFPFNFLHLASKAHQCASEQLHDYRVKLAAMHGKKTIVLTTVHNRPSTFSGREMPSYFAAGEAQAQQLFDTQLRDLI